MDRHPVREGIIAGIIGATSVAVWFFIVDLVSGRLLFTPVTLGRALLSVLGPQRDAGMFVPVAAYTLFHYAVFIIIGIVVAYVLRAAETEPSVLVGLLILFVAFELGFYGLTALLSEGSLFGSVAWYQIGAANLVAALMMGRYLWRGHPRAGARLRDALAGHE
jgi:hypothetical protein